VWPTKIAHCFAGAFPFEHAGGKEVPRNTMYRLFVFLFYYYRVSPVDSISYLLVLLSTVGLQDLWVSCAVQCPWDDAITMAPLRFVDSGSH